MMVMAMIANGENARVNRAMVICDCEEGRADSDIDADDGCHDEDGFEEVEESSDDRGGFGCVDVGGGMVR